MASSDSELRASSRPHASSSIVVDFRSVSRCRYTDHAPADAIDRRKIAATARPVDAIMRSPRISRRLPVFASCVVALCMWILTPAAARSPRPLSATERTGLRTRRLSGIASATGALPCAPYGEVRV